MAVLSTRQRVGNPFEDTSAPTRRLANPSRLRLEVLRRLERLLDALDRPTPEEILHTRCVEILERIGSAEAKKLLRRLADGDPLQVLTREARAALSRLERRDR
jgi:hypothetical protein